MERQQDIVTDREETQNEREGVSMANNSWYHQLRRAPREWADREEDKEFNAWSPSMQTDYLVGYS